MTHPSKSGSRKNAMRQDIQRMSAQLNRVAKAMVAAGESEQNHLRMRQEQDCHSKALCLAGSLQTIHQQLLAVQSAAYISGYVAMTHAALTALRAVQSSFPFNFLAVGCGDQTVGLASGEVNASSFVKNPDSEI